MSETCKTCSCSLPSKRFVCLQCPDFKICETCEENEFEQHFGGSHTFVVSRAKISDEQLQQYRTQLNVTVGEKKCKTPMFDSYAFHRSQNFSRITNDMNALEFVKKMLKTENDFRLSKEYLDEYAKQQNSDWKLSVTEQIQQRVSNMYLEEAKSRGYYDSITSGVDFLRGAVGNFPSHINELMECANYIKYTQFCVRGNLRVGDYVDGNSINLYDPFTLEPHKFSEYYSDKKPTVIIASSYT
eukprot:TRINITY_DN174_c0_g1_i1.p1 TRINITY_DN174_c0_g1~~TRINITY_DN174_c0_g1_i1.p1  ORF type:complete len:259 (+),score=33.47 TRINITY_DN174_c0_g1_i1:54-779(+)